MLRTLLESRRPRAAARGARGATLSAALHAATIAAVVTGTARATDVPRGSTPDERIVYRASPALPPPPSSPASPPRPPTPARPALPAAPTLAVPTLAVATLAVPTTISVELPPPGPAPLVDPATFVGRGVAVPARAGDGVPGAGDGSGAPAGDGVHAASLVERAVVPLGGAAPRYPEPLRAAGVEGTVLVEFVVDATGRVEPASVRVLASAHPLFEQAVRAALRGLRFRPAEVGGRAVRQLVQQPFVFAVRR